MAAKSKPLGQARQAKKTAPTAIPAEPAKFTYALKGYTAERRAKGWYCAVTVANFLDANQEWHGPFETIESACLAIARRLAVEIADRHTRSIEFHKIDKEHPLYGLKPTTRIDAR